MGRARRVALRLGAPRGRGRANGHPATASSARVSRFQSASHHPLGLCGYPFPMVDRAEVCKQRLRRMRSAHVPCMCHACTMQVLCKQRACGRACTTMTCIMCMHTYTCVCIAMYHEPRCCASTHDDLVSHTHACCARVQLPRGDEGVGLPRDG